MKAKNLEAIFADYKKAKTNKSERLSKSERNAVKAARNVRKDKNAIWVSL